MYNINKSYLKKMLLVLAKSTAYHAKNRASAEALKHFCQIEVNPFAKNHFKKNTKWHYFYEGIYNERIKQLKPSSINLGFFLFRELDNSRIRFDISIYDVEDYSPKRKHKIK